jgi:hypothetical protein
MEEALAHPNAAKNVRGDLHAFAEQHNIPL